MVREPDPVLKHIRFDVTVNQSKFCLLGSCLSKSTIFKGSHVTVHFKRFHQEEYELVVQEKKGVSLLRQDPTSSRPPSKKIDHSVTNKLLLLCWSVTESGHPFR